jgi:hypothetical protein
MRRLFSSILPLTALMLLTACGGATSPPVTATPGPTAAPLPTSAPVPGTPSPGQDLSLLIKQELDKMPVGQMLFNPPAEMEQGRAERIELRLTQNLSEDISQGLKGSGQPEIQPLKIGTFMRARLTGDDFEIKALNDEEQVVSGDSFTQWAWDVTPLDSGKRTLHLAVTIRIKVGGLGEEHKDYPVIDRDVNVSVNPGFFITGFVKSNWQWLVTAIVIPLLGLGWRIYSGRSKKPEGKV